MQFIESITSEYTVDLITLKDGRVVGIDGSTVVLYESMDDVWDCNNKALPTIELSNKN
jgi:hypothetical protein